MVSVYFNIEKVPQFGYYHCNCLLKVDMWSSCDIHWKYRPDFCMLMYSPSKRSRKNLIRSSFIGSHKDVNNHLKSCNNHQFLGKGKFVQREFSTRSQVFEEPWLFNPDESKLSNTCTLKENEVIEENPKFKFDSYYPVEEPWLFEKWVPPLTSNTQMVVPDVLEIEEKKVDPTPNVVTEENLVTTVILINSSICTMQRIAVLENEKLVELLFEPVKNNVLCDSVYLGIVTKLVPHMGGAFVNIGCSRPSFMDIKTNREPFIFLPFNQIGFVKDDILSVNDTNDHFEDENNENNEDNEDNEDNSDDEYLEDCDISDMVKNSNGSFVNGVKNGLKKMEKQEEDHLCNNGSKWGPVKKGTKILVQVVKEGLGTKGPTLTAYPKLRSRFWLLITRSNTIGISKKISGVERTRLRVIAKSLQPQGFGLTVRTVASGHTLEELEKDLKGLINTWKSIMENAKSSALASDEGLNEAVPVLLHRALGKTLSVAQDYFTDKVKSMVVDSPRTYHEVTNYLQDIAPNLCDRVELYTKRTPLFDEYKIEEEIDNVLSKRVPLTNGGYLVIEQTEALVSIDVNGGQCVLGQGTSQEKAILDVNLVAAKQIARELRLRDVGGIIVVDFIDMMDDSNKRLVYEEVKKAVERDRSTVKVSELSRHGLMEITRKRVRPSVTFMISEPCTCCHGTGRVEALETSYSKIEHEICRMLSMTEIKVDPENPKSWVKFILRVDRHMCNYLTSGKRTRLAVLSSSLKVWILLKVARGFSRGGFELKALTDEKEEKNNQNQLVIPLLRPTNVAISYIPTRSSKKISLIPLKKWKSGGK